MPTKTACTHAPSPSIPGTQLSILEVQCSVDGGNPFGYAIGGQLGLSGATIRVEALKDPDDEVHGKMVVKCGNDISKLVGLK